jgi:nitrous oxide reductase
MFRDSDRLPEFCEIQIFGFCNNKEKEMKSTKSIKSRRDFLKGAATTAAGVGIVATASKTASADGIEKHSQGGYRETKHVKTYYELAKF